MKVELRNDSVHIEGYVNVVERDSKVINDFQYGKFIERVQAKTFQRALEKQNNVDVLFNHLENRKLGSTKDGTLNLHEDNIGLYASFDTSDAEVVDKAENGKLTGWSFSFRALKSKWEDGDNGIKKRLLEDIILPEVSILSVTPAYIATSVNVEQRNSENTLLELRNFDDITLEDRRIKEKHKDLPNYNAIKSKIEIIKLKQLGY